VAGAWVDHSHLVPRLRMSGVIPPPPCRFSSLGQGQLYLLLHTVTHFKRIYVAEDRNQWPALVNSGRERSERTKGGEFVGTLSDCQFPHKSFDLLGSLSSLADIRVKLRPEFEVLYCAWGSISVLWAATPRSSSYAHEHRLLATIATALGAPSARSSSSELASGVVWWRNLRCGRAQCAM
jgi:hypothetical protein